MNCSTLTTKLQVNSYFWYWKNQKPKTSTWVKCIDMGFLQKLQNRLKLNSLRQVVLVLIVFACTGFSVLFLKKPILAWLLDGDEPTLTFTILYWIFIFPIQTIPLP